MEKKLKYKLGTTEIIAFVVAILTIVGTIFLLSNIAVAKASQIEIFVGILCLFSALYGLVIGGLIGFLGVICVFVIRGDSVLFSYALSMCAYGMIVGCFANRYGVREGQYKKKNIALFLIAEALASIVALVFMQPYLDFIFYGKDLFNAVSEGMRICAVCAIPMNVVMAIILYVVNIFYRDNKSQN